MIIFIMCLLFPYLILIGLKVGAVFETGEPPVEQPRQGKQTFRVLARRIGLRKLTYIRE